MPLWYIHGLQTLMDHDQTLKVGVCLNDLNRSLSLLSIIQICFHNVLFMVDFEENIQFLFWRIYLVQDVH